MERQKRWQLILIVAVLLITLYNILPTIFFYSKPLKQPIGPERSQEVAEQIVARVDVMEEDAIAWLHSFVKLIHVNPSKIELRQSDPRFVDVVFPNSSDAQRFKTILPRAGSMIPFVPAQLQLGQEVSNDQTTTIVVERRIGVHLAPEEIPELFQFTTRFDDQGLPAPLFKNLVYDRLSHLTAAVAGTSDKAHDAQLVAKGELSAEQQDLLLTLAQDVVDSSKALATSNTAIFKRIAHSYSQSKNLPDGGVAKALSAQMQALTTKLTAQRQTLVGKPGEAKPSLDPETRERIGLLDQQLAYLSQAAQVLQKYQADFDTVQEPITAEGLRKQLASGVIPYDAASRQQVIDLKGRNPFIKSILVDWDGNQFVLSLYDDINKIVNAVPNSDEQAFLKDKVTQLLINDIAHISQISDEALSPRPDGYGVNLSTLTDSHSLMAFNLAFLAKKEAQQVQELLTSTWHPQHGDLERSVYPIHSYADYLKLPLQDQRLGLVVFAPALSSTAPPDGFETDGIYVIARGLEDIVQKYRDIPTAEGGQALVGDFNGLVALLEQRGFMHYPGSSWGVAPEFKHDYIFRLPNYYDSLLKATREDFIVKGSKQFAVLDYTDVEQRILATNRIEDQIHEDLLKWRDEYHSAQVDLDPANRLFVPAPTKNVYVDNFELSARKYFRGDDAKVLKWGLDLSGGKTVRIGLTDQNGRPVTKPEDLNQAVNELYTRINKMGVAERSIRIEGNNIILDFPGSQGLSAADLVKASTMTFHIVNEKFGPPARGSVGSANRDLFAAAERFLQDVWNEAVVTNRKDIDSINGIAWKHLGGDSLGGQVRPRSEQARLLYENNLRLGNPAEKSVSGAFDDAVSSIAVRKGDDYTDWQGHTHPLIFVFRNYALEGSSLTNVGVGYDPSEGNMLSFEVKSSYEGNRQGDPRDDFYAWTSQFSKEEIAGTPKEKYTGGDGWRMAVILNDHIISSPTLQAALRDRARITGRFSQREVNQLAADLKAGSLSFTPRILSEENISPDLGLEDRVKGMIAFGAAILSVIVAMIGYYRFAGLVACVAVLLNLLIMWGVLQNIGAALTLPGIAGLVLTIGMAVDANVLVFERFREEFLISGRLGSALQAGYRKAFSAIVDSNLTTIIAALILTQFDSGPIKGFAIVIIIGIASSMFTGLFMTRFFFAGWVQNPKHRHLTMSRWISNTKIDFLKYAKMAFVISGFVCLLSIYLVYSQRNTIMGMDFTGGYSLTLELQEKPGTSSYRLAAKEALEKQGIAPKDVQVKQLSRPNQIKIQLGMGIEEPKGVFHGLPEELPAEGKYEYQYERNPRIVWVVNALHSSGLEIRQADLDQLYNRWTVMSGQFSDTMRDNALWALTLALAAILLYITFRFEFKYAIGAVVGLANDVIISLGVLALMHLLGFSVQIDLEIMGAVMAILGYSLNDTIIVFDRIREDVRILRKMEFRDMVNHALNITLSRTLITSGTTLMVLMCMLVFGGSSIFGFSLVMTVGVIVGTLSSLFVASPIMLYFHEREVRQQEADYKLRKV